jgi:plastocyanin
VTWVVKSPSQAHNLAFGPLAWLKKFQNKNDLFPFPVGSPNQVLPTFPYGSDPVDPATGAYAYDGTNHGNGVLITPQIDRLDSAWDFLPIELPGTARVTFTKPGTYHYICQLHGPQMSGDIIVTG